MWGTHSQLMAQEGLYQTFVSGRKESSQWEALGEERPNHHEKRVPPQVYSGGARCIREIALEGRWVLKMEKIARLVSDC